MAEVPHVLRPAWGWFAALDGGIAALVVLSGVEGAYDAIAEVSPPYLVGRPVSSMMRVGSPAVPVWLITPCSC
jgi:hypothetical protein